MDWQEFDPLSKQSESDLENRDLNMESVPVRSYQPLNLEDEAELASNALIRFDGLSDNASELPVQRQMSEPSQSWLVSAPGHLKVKHSGSVPLRPSRPPPPPPAKARAVSMNSLNELDPKFVKLQIASSGSTSSLKHNSKSSTGYIGEQAEARNTAPRSSRSGSTFFSDPSSESGGMLPTRNSRSGSSFYIDSSKEVITRQPATMSSGGSSFYGSDMSNARKTSINPEKLLGAREQVMELCMAKRQDEYTVRKPFRIFTGTWNVNGQIPPKDVKNWLSSFELEKDPPDIYFIGFQELDLSKEAYVFSDSLREDAWIEVVTNSLPTNNVKYHLLKCIRLVGMMLLVYTKTVHFSSIRNLSWHQVGTGLLGRMGNKGGVSVRMDLHNSSICAVNCHLAAHMEQCKRRNEDYRDICSRLQFAVLDQPPMSLFQHDVVFWLGDLNYRIQDLPSEEVKDEINVGRYKLLREHDQLLIEKKSGNVFRGFSEGVIDFRPTYKYNTNTDEWDNSEKCRTPAWCDRVLWWEKALNGRNSGKAKPKSSVELLKYQQHMSLKISDHKPVSALFNVKVKVVDVDRYKEVFQDENRRLDKLENEYLPTMTLDTQQVDFGEVKFQQPKLQTVDIDNNGMIPCNFEFISRPGEPDFCKKWLTITKPKGCLLPGEKFVLEFEVYVNRVTAPLFNSGAEKLEDILILHLSGGKDFFITVNGRYLPSCFGTSIEALCRLTKPIRSVTTEEIQKLTKIHPNRDFDLVETSRSLEIPKELWTLIDHLYKYAKKQEDLFQQPGFHSEVEDIRDCLDSKIDTASERIRLPGSNHSVAEALLILLEAFPEPVIPFDFYEQCLEVCEIFHPCKQVLQRISKHHRTVFKYIAGFLKELLRHSEENGLNLDLVANIFSGLMIRPPPQLRKQRIEARMDREKAKKFLLHFLKNAYDD